MTDRTTSHSTSGHSPSSQSPSNPCTWCKGKGKIKKKQQTTFLKRSLSNFVLFFIFLALLALFYNLFDHFRASDLGIFFGVVAIALAVLLYMNFLPESLTSFIFRSKFEDCPRCGGRGSAKNI